MDLRRFFTPRVSLRPTPFLRGMPSDTPNPPSRTSSPSTSSPISASRTWAPVNTVANQDDLQELVNRIRSLHSDGSEDRPLILEVCDRASTEATARAAIRTLMHEFRDGCADAQLSAARLWAILLRNSSVAFIVQSTAVDFLETIEALILSNSTSPVVRNRLLHVLGDAVHSNPNQQGFRRLWMAVKPEDAPEQGRPYDAHDAILRSSGHRYRQNATGILDRMHPPTPQSRAIDPRFPYEWDAPPSYETATNILEDSSMPNSPLVFVTPALNETSLADSNIRPSGRSVAEAALPLQPPALRITPSSDRLNMKSRVPIRDTPVSMIEATYSTARPTAIRMPLVQSPNAANLAVPSTSSQPITKNAPRNVVRHQEQKPIYPNTLAYLKGVASSEQHFGAARSLEGFGREMAKLSPVDCLVYAMRYRDILTQVSSDLGVAGYPQFHAALEEDQPGLAETVLEILYSPEDEQAVLALEDDNAQSVLDIIQHTVDSALLRTRDANSRARRLVGKLAKACDKLPSSLLIYGVTQRDEHASFCGGFGDVFKAMYQGNPVALKHMRIFQGTDQRHIRRKFAREALVWQRLRHQYIAPLIGIDTESFPSSLCMVSPWMRNGTVIKYLTGIGHAERQRTVDRLIHEIAQGLAFLHDQNVVHGDLRGTNILVNDVGHACLTDFGLTVLSDATVTQTNNGAGSVRWMAPETLNPSACGLTDFARTPASDIYAFACVCFELYTGFPPFHRAILLDVQVMFQVLEGVRPSRPAGDVIPDHIWNIMEQCWAHNFVDRPTILGIVLELTLHERRQAERGFGRQRTW